MDKHGIVWITLTTANAIARIDPKVATPGSFNGIKVFDLVKPCTDAICRRPVGPVAGAAPLTRLPLQMKVRDDGQGDTDLFFTEQNADAIGALRVSPNGDRIDERHFPCVLHPAARASRSIPTATSGTARARAIAWAG